MTLRRLAKPLGLIAVASALATFAAVTFAQAPAATSPAPAVAAGPLSRADIDALTAGKRWSFRRADGMQIALDFRSGGVVYGRPANFPQSDTGSYSVNERNQLCVQWQVMRQDSGCFFIERAADGRLRATSPAGGGQVVAEIAVE